MAWCSRRKEKAGLIFTPLAEFHAPLLLLPLLPVCIVRCLRKTACFPSFFQFVGGRHKIEGGRREDWGTRRAKKKNSNGGGCCFQLGTSHEPRIEPCFVFTRGADGEWMQSRWGHEKTGRLGGEDGAVEECGWMRRLGDTDYQR